MTAKRTLRTVQSCLRMGVTCVVLAGCTLAASGRPAAVEAILDRTENGFVRVTYDQAGRTDLEGMIRDLRSALGVPEDLDERDENRVGAFVVALENRPWVDALSQCYFAMANAFLSEDVETRETYLRGKNWGMKSLRMDSQFASREKRNFVDAVEVAGDEAALYWTSLNWLRTAEYDKVAAFASGMLPKVAAMLERARAIDPTYCACGPDRALGAFWGGLPRLPFGTYRKNIAKAQTHLCRAVQSPACDGQDAPDPACGTYLENALVFVEYYLMQIQDWDTAAQKLQWILDASVSDRHPLEDAMAKQRAQLLLQNVQSHQ